MSSEHWHSERNSQQGCFPPSSLSHSCYILPVNVAIPNSNHEQSSLLDQSPGDVVPMSCVRCYFSNTFAFAIKKISPPSNRREKTITHFSIAKSFCAASRDSHIRLSKSLIFCSVSRTPLANFFWCSIISFCLAIQFCAKTMYSSAVR